jgi:hypothetical protein
VTGVPQAVFATELKVSIVFAKPKSAILASKFFVSKIFYSLRSL